MARNTLTLNADGTLDGVQMAIINKRMEAICAKMANTLLRTGRSGVLNSARDFSCCIVTAENRLLTVNESLPIHVLRGADMMCESMQEFHPVLKRGDAFLHNSPYHGCSHPADHTILAPVVDDGGVHRFTMVAKAHQADCGNSIATTYHGSARDVYEEGALIFPAVQIQRDYEDIEDIVRMCRLRIRVPEQWWGDYLAELGAARIGEREIMAFGNEIGWDTLAQFAEQWFDYSEQLMIAAVRKMPGGRAVTTSMHDPFPNAEDGIPVKIVVDVDPARGDDRHRPPRQPGRDALRPQPLAGLLREHAAARRLQQHPRFGADQHRLLPPRAHAPQGEHRLRHPQAPDQLLGGDHQPRRPRRQRREPGDRGPGRRLRHGQHRLHHPALPRRHLRPRARRPRAPTSTRSSSVGAAARPAPRPTPGSPSAISATPACPTRIPSSSTRCASRSPCAAGTSSPIPAVTGGRAAAPASTANSGRPRAISRSATSATATSPRPKAHAAAHAGGRANQFRRDANGDLHRLDPCAQAIIPEGHTIVSYSCGGGGYGAPTERPAEQVAIDVRERWVSPDAARETYRVALDDSGALDKPATDRLRNG